MSFWRGQCLIGQSKRHEVVLATPEHYDAEPSFIERSLALVMIDDSVLMHLGVI